MAAFADGDVDAARTMLNRHPELATRSGCSAHPLLREFVERNQGHCYKLSHLRIAEFLTPDNVRFFRDAVVNDRSGEVQQSLRADANLIHAEFTAGRGIAQAMHHWKSVAVGEILIDSGANFEALTTLGESPLTMQLRFGTIEGVRWLLEKGVNPNVGAGGHMPSGLMAEMIELLLAHNWDIDRGEMLHDANHGHGTRVQTWLKYGANPNSRNEVGQTALHLIAARGTGRDAIRALVGAGADIDARDNLGNRPLDLARAAKQQTATQELISLGAGNAS